MFGACVVYWYHGLYALPETDSDPHTLPCRSHCAGSAEKQSGPSDKAVAKWTNQQLQQILVVPAERIFDRIGWADSLLQAEELARRSGRPIFLFKYDGDLAAGRC